MHGNHIKVSIEIEVTNAKPYYLKFEYAGDSLFKDRLLNIAEAGEYVLTAERKLFKNSFYYRWRRYPRLTRKQWWPSLDDLFNRESIFYLKNRESIFYLKYENKPEAEAACFKIQKLLNDFIEKEWKIYNELVLELQQK